MCNILSMGCPVRAAVIALVGPAKSSSVVKTSPVSSPIKIEAIPTATRGEEYFLNRAKHFGPFAPVKSPRSSSTSPCPASPNMIPNNSVKKTATSGVGSMVPYRGAP